nr:MAG TPA: hypothetical protein [Caudoviricetes sp.]
MNINSYHVENDVTKHKFFVHLYNFDTAPRQAEDSHRGAFHRFRDSTIVSIFQVYGATLLYYISFCFQLVFLTNFFNLLFHHLLYIIVAFWYNEDVGR